MTEAEIEAAVEDAKVERAFGAQNRRRILDAYFDEVDDLSYGTAWEHVYRLLLWINPTISLAHCYESDKCQPHKAWYARSLAFHRWVSAQLGLPPRELREDIDHLFREALPALARVETKDRRESAVSKLKAYGDVEMPLPGEDPDLVELIADSLGVDQEGLTEETERALVERVYAHFAQENKRKNLLGRGFEDTLAVLIEHLSGTEDWQVRTRVPIGEIPGFVPQSEDLKQVEVDLALWDQTGKRRVLVSAKWSVRADRERQFDSDFDDYSRANTGGPFDYVLITNEFDAARIDAACMRVRGNQYLFTRVVHVQPEGVFVAYGDIARPSADSKLRSSRQKAAQLATHVERGRLVSLEEWLGETFT